MIGKKQKDKCAKCSWAFANWCLAYPIIVPSGYYNRDRSPSYKLQADVTAAECKKMFVERIGNDNPVVAEKRAPRPKRIIKSKNEKAVDLWS